MNTPGDFTRPLKRWWWWNGPWQASSFQLVKKFCTVYGNRNFNTVFTAVPILYSNRPKYITVLNTVFAEYFFVIIFWNSLLYIWVPQKYYYFCVVLPVLLMYSHTRQNISSRKASELFMAHQYKIHPWQLRRKIETVLVCLTVWRSDWQLVLIFFLGWRFIPYSFRFWRMTQKRVELSPCLLASWHASVV